MKIEEAKAIADGYNCIRYCDAILADLEPADSGTPEDGDFPDRWLPDNMRQGEAGALGSVMHKLDRCPKAIRERVELLVQELRSLMIQDFVEIKEAAVAQLEKR